MSGCKGPEAECAECVMSGRSVCLCRGIEEVGAEAELRVGKTFTLDRTQDGKLSALIVLEESLWEGFRGGEGREPVGRALQ